MILLEALACEKPVVTTPTGIYDIIQRESLGIVTDGFDPKSIARGIEKAIGSHFSGLREFVKKKFTWTKAIQKTLAVYERLLEEYPNYI